MRRRRRRAAIGVAGLSIGTGMMISALFPMLSEPSTAIAASAARTLAVLDDAALPEPPMTERPQDLQVADPRRVVIPTLNVMADIVPLGLQPDGTLEVPEDFDLSGWYEDGPEPGEPGASVIVGHVDSYEGPAVFYGLGQLLPGAEVIVEAVDGTSSVFVVERIEQYPKDQFPTAAVYGDTEEPTLRLITCGGTFDHGRRSYRDNIVVFARRIR